MRIAQRDLGGNCGQSKMDPWLHLQHSLLFKGASWGWGHAMSCCFLEDNKHNHAKPSPCFDFMFSMAYSQQQYNKMERLLKGKRGEIQTKPGLLGPPSPLSEKMRRLLASFSFYCMSACWWELPSKHPSCRDLQCRCLLEENMSAGRWRFLKELNLWWEKKCDLSKEEF